MAEPSGTAQRACRWHSRQLLIRIDIRCSSTSIVWTSPWQVWHSTPAFTWGLWSKKV